MAGVRYFEQSFFELFWQNVVDFNAELIEIPLGTLSPDLNGFAFENVDGTYTVFLGAVTFFNSVPAFGEVTDILRLSSIAQAPTIGTTLATVNDSFSAGTVYQAYRDGGTQLFSVIFDGGDSLGFEAPASLGPLGQSPLIETFDGDDVVDGSLHGDTIFAGAGDDEVNGRGGNDEIHGGGGNDNLIGGAGVDFLDGGNGFDTLNGNGGDDIIDGGEDIELHQGRRRQRHSSWRRRAGARQLEGRQWHGHPAWWRRHRYAPRRQRRGHDRRRRRWRFHLRREWQRYHLRQRRQRHHQGRQWE